MKIETLGEGRGVEGCQNDLETICVVESVQLEDLSEREELELVASTFADAINDSVVRLRDSKLPNVLGSGRESAYRPYRIERDQEDDRRLRIDSLRLGCRIVDTVRDVGSARVDVGHGRDACEARQDVANRATPRVARLERELVPDGGFAEWDFEADDFLSDGAVDRHEPDRHAVVASCSHRGCSGIARDQGRHDRVEPEAKPTLDSPKNATRAACTAFFVLPFALTPTMICGTGPECQVLRAGYGDISTPPLP